MTSTDYNPASLIPDLENNFLYDLQHIRIYKNGGTEVTEVKYFSDSDLLRFLMEGLKECNEDNIISTLYAAIRALKIVIGDIENRTVRAQFSETDANNFPELVKDYQKMLSEFKKSMLPKNGVRAIYNKEKK